MVSKRMMNQTKLRKRWSSRIYSAVAIILFVATSFGPALAQEKPASQTQVVLMGTGTPLPDPERAGPCTAIVVNGTPYLVDLGTGVVRRAAAARNKDVKALEPINLKIGFITHLHSDHTLGVADVLLTPWVMGRKEPFELYGPPGTRTMVPCSGSDRGGSALLRHLMRSRGCATYDATVVSSFEKLSFAVAKPSPFPSRRAESTAARRIDASRLKR